MGIIQGQGKEAAFCPGWWLNCAGSGGGGAPNLPAAAFSLSQLTIQPAGMDDIPCYSSSALMSCGADELRG